MKQCTECSYLRNQLSELLFCEGYWNTTLPLISIVSAILVVKRQWMVDLFIFAKDMPRYCTCCLVSGLIWHWIAFVVLTGWWTNRRRSEALKETSGSLTLGIRMQKLAVLVWILENCVRQLDENWMWGVCTMSVVLNIWLLCVTLLLALFYLVTAFLWQACVSCFSSTRLSSKRLCSYLNINFQYPGAHYPSIWPDYDYVCKTMIVHCKFWPSCIRTPQHSLILNHKYPQLSGSSVLSVNISRTSASG